MFSSTFAFSAESPLIPTITFAKGFLDSPNFTQSDDYTINDDIWITSDDGVTLTANVITPTSGADSYPAIIFINSWTMNEYEYTSEAQKLAADGYVVLSYSTRGFGSSEGLIDTAGPNDTMDLSIVIDWLIENTPTDPERIGVAGISYGAGIALIGAAHDSRIKAVASMSGWGSLIESLYGNSTTPLAWGQILDYSSQITGRPDPVIHEYYNVLLNQEVERIDELTEWGRPRSPISFIDQINSNGTAIYLNKNWGDYLFPSNNTLDFYQQLNTPKHLTLVPGTHASNELLGMLGLGSNKILKNARRWFDHFLKGEDNGIQHEPPVQMEVKSNGHVETFDDYPVPGTQMVQYYLHPRGFGLAGELEDTPFQSRWSRSDYINSYLDTLADSGIPVISQLVEQFDIPTTAYIPAISRLNGVWYETNRLDRTMKIRGNANLTLQFEPLNSQVQVVAYLYDMKPSGMGTLITHAPFTLPVTQSGKAITLDFDLLATAYDVPQGHKLVLAIDTQDSSYGKLPDSKFKLKIKYHSGQQSVLKLPVL